MKRKHKTNPKTVFQNKKIISKESEVDPKEIYQINEEVDEEEPAGSQTQKSHLENYSSSALFNPRSKLE